MNAGPQLYSSWTKRCVEVSRWYRHVDNKQLTTSEKNQSSPAILCKTLFNVYTICMHQIKFYTFGEILRSDVQARIS